MDLEGKSMFHQVQNDLEILTWTQTYGTSTHAGSPSTHGSTSGDVETTIDARYEYDARLDGHGDG